MNTSTQAWHWGGFYAGVNIGWGGGEKTGELSEAAIVGSALMDGRIPHTFGLGPDGVIGGGQIGYNWQENAIVYGIEADLQASSMKGRTSVSVPAILPDLPSLSSADERLKWFGTVRGRLGFTPADRSLLYLTGGFAFGRVSNNADFGFLFPGGGFDGYFAGSHSHTKFGWTIGAGAEHAWSNNWSLKVEYLYVDLGGTTLRLNSADFVNQFLDYRFEHRDHIVRIGLNYKFD